MDENKKIFNRTWEEINRMQHKQVLKSGLNFKALPTATEQDKIILKTKGAKYIKDQDFLGTLDRLKNSNLI